MKHVYYNRYDKENFNTSVRPVSVGNRNSDKVEWDSHFDKWDIDQGLELSKYGSNINSYSKFVADLLFFLSKSS